jgi:hypothetical protein
LSLQEFQQLYDQYENSTKGGWRLYIAMFLPGKEKEQAILNMIYTAKRAGFSTKCTARVISQIYLITQRQAMKYIRKANKKPLG